MMNRSTERALALLATTAIMLACAERAPTSVRSMETLALKAGQERQLAGSRVFIAMVKVEEDSRCPSDVQCVWAGIGVVAIAMRAGSDSATTYRLNTIGGPQKITALGYEVTLDSLTPYPRMSRPFPKSDYVAYLTVLPKAP